MTEMREFDPVIKRRPSAATELPTTLVWSHPRTSDRMLKWFRELVRDVAADVYEQNPNGAPIDIVNTAQIA
jgi:hypothetical protein